MTTISIIGSGNMASGIGARAAGHGHTVEIISRDAGKAQALAEQIGHGATTGTFGAAPSGDIVILAVPYAAAVDAVTQFGDGLAGKVLIDITNPFNADASGIVTTPGDSITQQISAATPDSTQVVKAFNMLFRGVVASDRSVDVFFAGGNAEARASVAAFLESLGLRPRDAGGLESTFVIEWAAILLMNLARNGAGFDMALGVDSL